MSREFVLEAVRTMLALDSVRVDCTLGSEDDTVIPKRGATRLTQIVVGDDCYRSGDIEGGELAEHVRAILGEPTESLHYRASNTFVIRVTVVG